MPATLASLEATLRLTGGEVFAPDFQDSLGFALLKRRGFATFITRGEAGLVAFGLGLAQEWASLPVLADTRGAHMSVRRGQSFYAGVFTNRALVPPERVEDMLRAVLTLPSVSTVISKTQEVVMSSPSSPTILPPSGTGDAKPWYLSKGVIGGVIAVAIPILSIFFPAMRIADPSTVTEWVMKIIDIAGPVIGGLIAVLGRVQATQPIAGTKAAQQNAFGGALPLPQIVGSMLDLPLNAIAADLPQVLLMLQNVGQAVAATGGPGTGITPHDGGGADAGQGENGAANGLAHDSAGIDKLTLGHIEAVQSLVKQLVDAGPKLAGVLNGKPS